MQNYQAACKEILYLTIAADDGQMIHKNFPYFLGKTSMKNKNVRLV